MAVVVDRPAHIHYVERDSSSSLGWVLGLALLVLLAIALFYYGLPALRGRSYGGTNINVPDKINVNYSGPQAPAK